MLTRRKLIKSALAGATIAATNGRAGAQDNKCSKLADTDSRSVPHPDHCKNIPGTNQCLPSIGMGTWITFDVGREGNVRKQRSRVLQQFFDHGGQMVDSSPMYGNAEEVIGYCLKTTTRDCDLFAASKIWTPLAIQGGAQMSNSENLWGVDQMHLMYIHNLLNWKSHLPKLREWKASGRIRYLGVSTSHGRRHEQLEKLLKSQAMDFVQLTYNYDQRAAEERLIPIAIDNGVAVVVNRPFQRGRLIEKYRGKALPELAVELGCTSWAQFLLFFIVSHPDVTVAIPATSREDHMIENMSTMQLPLPDRQIRQLL